MKHIPTGIILAIFVGWGILAITREPTRAPLPPYIAGTVYNPAASFVPAPFPDVSEPWSPPAAYIPPPVVAPEWDPPTLEVPEINCIALTVFIEARGESTLGQALVASSIVNRARTLGIDECSVVSATGQYHTTLSADPWLIDADSWRRSLDIARIVRSDEYDLASCRGVTHFHANSVDPHWSSRLDYACKVDGHTYYRMPQ